MKPGISDLKKHWKAHNILNDQEYTTQHPKNFFTDKFLLLTALTDVFDRFSHWRKISAD